MKNNRLDWKGVGQFMAALVQIWTIIRHVVVRQRVGLEIIDWIIGEGEQIFRTALYELTDKYNEYKESLPSGPKDHVIEFDAVPFCPAGLTIAPDSDQIKTRVRGKRNLSEISIRLHLYDGQTNGKWLNGYYLKVKLDGQEVFGAQLLDFYLEHPDLIPEDWKKKGWIFFWGTIYRDYRGNLCVRFLFWNGTRWDSRYDWLACGWLDDSPAAVSANPQV